MLGIGQAEQTIADVMSNSFQDFYDDMDSTIKASQVMPNTYKYILKPSYANSGPVASDSVTCIDIVCDNYQVVSVENSYITAKMTGTLTASADLSKDLYTT